MIADRIRQLRENRCWTQSQLARALGITRSSVNAWELGISVPSTQYMVELASLFGVSTDYLLGLEQTAAVSVSGLTEGDIQMVHQLICHLLEKNNQNGP